LKNENPQIYTTSQQEIENGQVSAKKTATSTNLEKIATTSTKISTAQEKKIVATTTKKIVTKIVTKKTEKPLETVSVAINPPTITIVNNTIPALELNKKIRDSIVNILCIADSEGYLRPISGTGVIIDPKGIILTNAHIGQYFLVKDYPRKDFIHCFARTGSPAKEAYSLELMYLPSAWVENNLQNIVSDDPLGTGENDFALLKITGPYQTATPLPSVFLFLNPEPNPIFIYQNEDVELAGYPAGFLGALAISQNLYITSTLSKIFDVFTFKEDTVDVLSLGGTIVAQKGSSGGAVASLAGNLLGIIVTTTPGKTTGERDLHAITINHINNKLLETSGHGIKEVLGGDIAKFADDYNTNTAPALSKLLIDQIKKRVGAL